ncbi:MAG: COG3650 family protein [Erythrobacter sp.]
MALPIFKRSPLAAVLAASAMLAACSQGDDAIITDPEPFDGIGADEIITLAGTEPFWGIRIENEVATYSTPDDSEGQVFEVSRFAGNNGLGFSGTLDGAQVDITVTPGECSDMMSDRTYPFTATVAIDQQILTGCAFTDQQSFTGEMMP